MDDFGMDARIADRMGLDAQVETRRRAAAQGMARHRQFHGFVGRAGPLDGAFGELGHREPLPAVRRVPVFLQVLGLGNHHVDDAEIAGLERERRRIARREHRARRRQHGRCARRRRPARSRTARWSAPAPHRPPRRPRPPGAAAARAGAMRELVQLHAAPRRGSPRISAAQANDGLPSNDGPQMHHRLA
jgi:hypothetical protein